MRRDALTGAVALAAMALASCGPGREGTMINAGICADFKAPAASSTVTADPAAPVEDCLHRWAYSLAGGRDSAEVVADATAAACGAALGRWNETALSQQGGAQPNALSLTSGQPTNALAEHAAFVHGRALFYVVQARAGRCAAPPATNGVPAGT